MKILSLIAILILSFPLFANAEKPTDGKWFLMTRQGKCIDLEVAANNNGMPILTGVKSPEELIKKLKDSGAKPKVKGEENMFITVSEKELGIDMIFAKKSMCKKFIGMPK